MQTRIRKTATVVVLAIVVSAAGFVVIGSLQKSVLFPTHMIRAPDSPRGLPEDGEQVWIETDEGKVEGWYLGGDGRTEDSPGPAVIFAHGNGEIIDHWPRLMKWYAERGISVLLAEYRGYGRSAGSPGAEKIKSDFRAFRKRLVDRPEVDGERLIYHGRSLGGGAVCALAADHPPAAMVLQSTFTSVADVAWDHYKVPAALIQHEFPSAELLKELDVPILVTHGETDQIVPVEHGRQLHDVAPNSTFVELDCGHNDCPMAWDQIEALLEEHGLLPGT